MRYPLAAAPVERARAPYGSSRLDIARYVCAENVELEQHRRCCVQRATVLNFYIVITVRAGAQVKYTLDRGNDRAEISHTLAQSTSESRAVEKRVHARTAQFRAAAARWR